MVVETNMSKQSNRWDIISPEQCAKASIDMLGYDTVTRGHWKHRFIYWLISYLPGIIMSYSAKKTMSALLKKQNSPSTS